MSDLLVFANNSLIEQSKQSSKSKQTVNGDGFGIGWYPVHEDNEPGIFTSITPAWSNHNLRMLTLKLKTSAFCAHVRDATPGLPISSTNCHPFTYASYLWMHNGQIGNFELDKRRLLNILSDKAFTLIKGNTDSEIAFALFLDIIGFEKNLDAEQIYTALLLTIKTIVNISNHPLQESSILNFSISDGHSSIVTRFSSHPGETQPASLFYLHGTHFSDQHGNIESTKVNQDSYSTIISSEPLSLLKSSWAKIDRNHAIIASRSASPIIRSIYF